HRLWTVQQADRILVLRDGRIIERACSTPERSAHETLLEAEGFYHELYALQVKAETLEAEEAALAQGGSR
ncbi:MAG: hypothetical protein KGY78_10035, partial [Anaerolineae bacterium]|nr:hypothetical protein [Anaerolineae bacterium]